MTLSNDSYLPLQGSPCIKTSYMFNFYTILLHGLNQSDNICEFVSSILMLISGKTISFNQWYLVFPTIINYSIIKRIFKLIMLKVTPSALSGGETMLKIILRAKLSTVCLIFEKTPLCKDKQKIYFFS